MRRFIITVLVSMLSIGGMITLVSCGDNPGVSAGSSDDTSVASSGSSAENGLDYLLTADPRTLSRKDRLLQIELRSEVIHLASSPNMYVRGGWVRFAFYFPEDIDGDIAKIILKDPATGEKYAESKVSEQIGFPEWVQCVDENVLYYSIDNRYKYKVYFAVHMGTVHDVIIEAVGHDGAVIKSYYFNFDEHCKVYIESNIRGFEQFPAWDAPDYDHDKYENIW